ncbi:MAG: SusC/RagA family TonB-linked outer membrane protein [Flavobacteriales bacterium]|nr:MAG: SusC/RagA family TonB-linked outer membrane protein [Flavobacteriales bacterium]
MKYIYSILAVMLFGCQVMLAQQNTVSGTVTENEQGDPVIGASVVEKGTLNGTTTDFDGNFSLKITTSNPTLVISYMGFKTKEIPLNGSTNITVTLEEDTQLLDEVVVVGYGVIRKSDLTGSVGKVDVAELKKTNSLDAVQAMQGRMAGVNVISNSGSPGAGATIRIRGIGTVNNSNPLYVVDGFPSSDISYIAPSDIESMEILKDASATAIYGSRGANGVVLIKTKSGARGKEMEIEATTYLGISKVAKTLDMADATQFAHARETIGATDPRLQYILESEKNGTYLKGTNWQDEVTRVAFSNRHSVSVQGNNDKYNYNFGTTYSDEQGIIKGTKLKKFMLHTNNTYSIKENVKLGLNINYVWHKKPDDNDNEFYRSVLPGALRSDPVSAAWDTYTNFYGQIYYSPAQTNPALGIWQNSYTKTKDNRFVGNFFLQIDDLFTKGLSFRSQYGRSLIFNDYKKFSPEYYITASQKNDEQTLYRKRGNGDIWVNTNYFSYNKGFDKLNINATLGMELQATEWSDIWAKGYGVPADTDLQYLGAAKDAEKFQLGGGKGHNRLQSYFARTNFSWDNKYMITGTLRFDGSSRFTKDYRWGWFPSFSFGWNIANQDFMESLRDVIPVLKFRAGWGLVGNQDSASDFGYVTSVNNGYTYAFNKEIVEGSVQNQLANEELQWESAEQYNIGIDYGLFDNKLDGSIDYFVRKTKDMILSVPIPLYAGKRSPIINAGTMQNKGVEFSINYNNTAGDFTYGIGINTTWIKNEVTSLAGSDPIRSGSVGRIGNTTKTEEGREIAYFYGYKTNGIFQTQADLDNYVTSNGTAIKGPGGTTPQLGDVIFIDQNDDGLVDEEDKTYLGSASPNFTGGINLNLGYKNFDFTAFMNYSVGNEIFNAMYQSLYSTDMFETNISKDMALNHWSADNTTSNLPRLALTDSNQNGTAVSDRMVEDGSYLRLKQIQLGYTFSQDITQKMGIKRLRIYSAADNLLTFTKYSGLDPELFGLYENPLYYGVDMVNYPQPRIYSFGLNITF